VGLRLDEQDIVANVVGGLQIEEPAADLAVAAALVSSRLNAALPADCVYFGEISLSGSIRPVSHAPARLKEAQKLGFARAVLPSAAAVGEVSGATLRGITQLVELVAGIAATARGRGSNVDGADD
jgi:DNA repair protein RadA/Sms